MNLLMAAPFNPNGRYAGGISIIANSILDNDNLLLSSNINLYKFETSRRKRNKSQNKVNISNILNFLKIYKDISLEIEKNKIDCLYYHSSIGFALLKDLLVIKKVKKKFKVKTILHIHYADYENIVTKRKIIENKILKYMKKYVDRIVFLSNETRKKFIEKGIDESKTDVLYNFSMINFDKAVLNNKSSNNLNLLFVGSIDNRKGIFDILDSLESIKNEKYVLNVCGAATTDYFKEKFEKYLLNNNKVLFHGYVSGKAKAEIFSKADVLLLPSYGEGLPIVIMEALSAGCLIITSNVGAISEIISESNGFIINPGDKKALVNDISYLLENKKFLSTIQENNYYYSSNYSFDSFLKKFMEIILK